VTPVHLGETVLSIGLVSDEAARIRELEDRLADFSAALGKKQAEYERAAHERDEYRKLYELVLLELERAKHHLRAQNKSEKVDAGQVQLAFREVANLILPPGLPSSTSTTIRAPSFSLTRERGARSCLVSSRKNSSRTPFVF